ncbi:glutamate--tRNA ligase family protein [Demequina litorisediminis]|uniref:Glutamyl/glutaminyl-tRNA synthetase class Ib catalytic domain-containing protein n=1 Tax=Demequina litorisediminis TaxID=1849022 RepID=A0ABQ6IB25_9MICO|nr:hypothetical protein GCM10025876_06450 [Demequina litorisediminis]
MTPRSPTSRLLDALNWLGIDYDEGPGVGGPYEPYRQSQRHDLHMDVAARLLEAGYAYESFSTPEEIEARHKAAGRDPAWATTASTVTSATSRRPRSAPRVASP